MGIESFYETRQTIPITVQQHSLTTYLETQGETNNLYKERERIMLVYDGLQEAWLHE